MRLFAKCDGCDNPGRRFIMGPSWIVNLCPECVSKRIKLESRPSLSWVDPIHGNPMRRVPYGKFPIKRRATKGYVPGKYWRIMTTSTPGSNLDPCVYCGDKATTVDHIHPISKGGDDDVQNFAPACNRCNSTKSSQSVLMFLYSRLA